MDDKTLIGILTQFKTDISKDTAKQIALARADISKETAKQIALAKADISKETAKQIALAKADISKETTKQIALARADISKDTKRQIDVAMENLDFKFGVIIDNIKANKEVLDKVRAEIKSHNKRITNLESTAHTHVHNI